MNPYAPRRPWIVIAATLLVLINFSMLQGQIDLDDAIFDSPIDSAIDAGFNGAPQGPTPNGGGFTIQIPLGQPAAGGGGSGSGNRTATGGGGGAGSGNPANGNPDGSGTQAGSLANGKQGGNGARPGTRRRMHASRISSRRARARTG